MRLAHYFNRLNLFSCLHGVVLDMIDAKSILKLIKKYQHGSQYKSEGDAWTIFWDYKKKIEKRGGTIFSKENLDLTSMHLMLYLFCFGMGRATTKLIYSNITDFKEIVKSSKKELDDLNQNQIVFEKLEEKHRQKIKLVFNNLRKELEERGISGSTTMITKILMATWGQTPAYDSRFVSTYRKLLPRKIGYFYEADGYFDSLMTLKKASDKLWRCASLSNMNDKLTKTPKGNIIPRARLIDMAFYSRGRRKTKK